MWILGLIYINNWLLGLAIILYLLYLYGSINNDVWDKRGVPGPKPVLPFLGNFLPIMRKGIHTTDLEWHRQYGKVFGVLEGRMPAIKISDPELVKQIFIRDFHGCFDRRSFDLGDELSDVLLKGVQNQRGADWKRTRSILTPTFTTGRLKSMIPLMNESCEVMTQNLKKHSEAGESIEAKSFMSRAVLDVIAKTMFGIDIDTQNNPDSPFIRHAKKIFKFSFAKVGVIFAFFAPELLPLAKKLPFPSTFDHDSYVFFRDTVNRALQLRADTTEGKKKRKDFVALMKDAHTLNEEIVNDATMAIDKESAKRGLNNDEIMAQSMTFLLAGNETTSTGLGMALYALANLPDVQERLYQELSEKLPVGEEITLEKLQSTEYLDMFLCELMRMYPPAVRFERQNRVNDYEIAGYKIPDGCTIEVDTLAIHYDEEIYPNPYEFRPERFTIEEKAKRSLYAYCPFGHGHRHCIGMRFAILEMKVILAAVVRQFEIKRASDTKEFPLDFAELKNPFGFTYPVEGINVKPVERK